MYVATLIFIVLHLKSAFSYNFNKPVAEKIWPQRCTANERILNDCNYCVCNIHQQFICSARICSEVDHLGHFKDTIAEIDYPMSGKASWRSTKLSCQPKMHYRRQDLLCVCDDDGNWPSPVCRDVFRVLHEIEVTSHTHPSDRFKCTPSKLYLFGCNVCFCSPTGRISPLFCTNNQCNSSDPIFREHEILHSADSDSDLNEVYATCDTHKKYALGCKDCVCLRNNRLLCDDKCKNETDTTIKKENTSNLCTDRQPNETFVVDCNVCVCDNNAIYCTTKKCLRENSKPILELSKTIDLTLRTTEPPLDGNECVPGTKYKDDCNTCFCTENEIGKKILSCTLKGCQSRGKWSVQKKLKTDCVQNTVYEKGCLVCRCDAVDGVKRESCNLDSLCVNKNLEPETNDLNALRGYCEPLHTYKSGCNTCQCLSDGKIAKCTTEICDEEKEKPVIVDIVPVSHKKGLNCIKGSMYQVECNFCFCLSDGNILCTTAKCLD